MKVKKSGDWRREILGDMTVMNAEEVALLPLVKQHLTERLTRLAVKTIG